MEVNKPILKLIAENIKKDLDSYVNNLRPDQFLYLRV